MKLTLRIQLLPDKKQADQLKTTMERFNQACSWLAEQAFEIKTTNKISLQQRFYYELRQQFGLSALMASICIRHVGGTYSRDKSVLPTFCSNAAMPYDSRKHPLLTLTAKEVTIDRPGELKSRIMKKTITQAACAYV
jgi:putative transposase